MIRTPKLPTCELSEDEKQIVSVIYKGDEAAYRASWNPIRHYRKAVLKLRRDRLHDEAASKRVFNREFDLYWSRDFRSFRFREFNYAQLFRREYIQRATVSA